MNLYGYECKTTFYDDFSIADAFGVKAVKDTYNRAFTEWRGNVEYLTELVMVLNWKTFEHHEKNNQLFDLYYDLFVKAEGYAYETLKDDELSYFIRTID